MGDYHVRFCERLGVKFPLSTRLKKNRYVQVENKIMDRKELKRLEQEKLSYLYKSVEFADKRFSIKSKYWNLTKYYSFIDESFTVKKVFIYQINQLNTNLSSAEIEDYVNSTIIKGQNKYLVAYLSEKGFFERLTEKKMLKDCSKHFYDNKINEIYKENIKNNVLTKDSDIIKIINEISKHITLIFQNTKLRLSLKMTNIDAVNLVSTVEKETIKKHLNY